MNIKDKNCLIDNDHNGWSYGWWQVCGNFGGRMFYNDYNYSTTTRKHQAWIRRYISNYVTVQAPEGLQAGLEQCIRCERLDIKRLIKDIRKPRSQAKKNAERRAEIAERLATIKIIKECMK